MRFNEQGKVDAGPLTEIFHLETRAGTGKKPGKAKRK